MAKHPIVGRASEPDRGVMVDMVDTVDKVDRGFRKRIFLHYILFILLILIIPSASAIELTGYYENSFLPELNDDHASLLDASKLRLDFNHPAEDGELSFTGNVNFFAYHTSVTYDLKPYLPPAVVDTLNAWDVPAEVTFDRFRMLLDNAFITWDQRPYRLRLGRQQLSWGSGYTCNPTDLFHRKDLTDPTYEKEGVTAFRVDRDWGVGGSLTGVFIPAISFERAGYCLRLAHHFNALGYDAGLTLHQVTDSTSLNTETLLPRIQRRRAVGLDFSGSLLGLGVWAEGNYNLMAAEDDFARVIAGADYTLKNGLYMMAEALYDGRAPAKAPYPALDWLEYLSFGEPVARWRFTGGLQRNITSLITGSVYVFGGVDNSWLVGPRLDISAAQNADVTVFGAAAIGDKNGQFPPGSYGLTVRTTFYF